MEIGIDKDLMPPPNDAKVGDGYQLAIYRGGSLGGLSVVGGTLVARIGNILTGGTDALQESLEPGDYS